MSKGDSAQATSVFRVFGLTVQCDFRCEWTPPPEGVTVDVWVEVDPQLQVPGGPPTISLPLANPDGGVGVAIYALGDEIRIVVDAVAVFSCTTDKIRYRLRRFLPLESLQWQLFGFVFSLWLEMQGRRVFHGAAIDVGGSAIGLLGPSGAGKSSLAAALVQEGCAILGDDHLIVDSSGPTLVAGPALPWIKLDPEVAQALGLNPDRMPSLHPAARKRRFDLPHSWQAREARPLAAIFLLDRGGADVPTVGPALAPAQALSRLVAHSSVPRSAQALGFSGVRLPVLARLAAEVPVRRFQYPHGLSDLRFSAQKVLQAVGAL